MAAATRGPFKSIAIGAGCAGLFVVLATIALGWGTGDLERWLLDPPTNIPVMILLGAVPGSAIGLALWFTRLTRRVSLFFLVPAWGVVCGVVGVFIVAVPICLLMWIAQPQMLSVPRGQTVTGLPAVQEALIWTYIGAPLFFPIGFIVGMILAPFKRPPKEPSPL